MWGDCMICDMCKKNEATVHITKIVNGSKQDHNLCEKCAMKKGELNFGSHIDFVSPFSFQHILSGIMDYISTANETQKSFDISCKNCGTTYNEFKEMGLLGCSECYQSFTSTLGPIIKRVQGNLEHTGKIPEKAGKDIIHKKRVLKLKEDLQKAIASEEYEKAAEVRDMIKKLQSEEKQED